VQRRPNNPTPLPCGSHQQMIERAEKRVSWSYKLKDDRKNTFI
jgi:hypothetical protein